MTDVAIPILKRDPLRAIHVLDKASFHYLIGGRAVADYLQTHVPI